MQVNEEPEFRPGELITDPRLGCIFRVAGSGQYYTGHVYYACRRICDGETTIPKHFLDGAKSTTDLSSVACSMCREDWSYIESHISKQYGT